MSSTGQIEGGRPLLKGRIFGFPVHLDLSFIIIMGVLGWYPGKSLRDMAIWLIITPIAVLVHELGHAVFARRIGARPSIALAGFGGVTTYVPPKPLSRLQDLSISLAGPFVGLAIGGVLILVARTYGDAIAPGSWQDVALSDGIWVSVLWSLLNLLPVLPLDGGQAMRELLPGDRHVRQRRAAMVSIGAAALAAVGAYFAGQPFLALFMGFFLISNVMELRRSPDGERVTPERAVVGLLWNGRADQARQLLESLPEGTEMDLAVHGAVLSLTGDPEQGHALLQQERTRRPDDERVLALVVLTQALEHDWDGVVATLQGPDGARVPDSAVERAAAEAGGTGREDVAGRLRLLRSQ